MIIAIDLDGTIGEEKRTFERALAKPLPGALDCLARLKAEGHRIIIYTARSWSEYELTKHWLETHNAAHDELIMGKPVVDMFIDDRAVRFTTWNDITALLNEGTHRAKRNPLALATHHAEQFRKWAADHPLGTGNFIEIASVDYSRYPGTLLRGEEFDLPAHLDAKGAQYQKISAADVERDGCTFAPDASVLAVHSLQHTQDVDAFAAALSAAVADNQHVFMVTPWMLPRSANGQDNWRMSADAVRYVFTKKYDFDLLHVKHVGFEESEANAVAIEFILKRRARK